MAHFLLWSAHSVDCNWYVSWASYYLDRWQEESHLIRLWPGSHTFRPCGCCLHCLRVWMDHICHKCIAQYFADDIFRCIFKKFLYLKLSFSEFVSYVKLIHICITSFQWVYTDQFISSHWCLFSIVSFRHIITTRMGSWKTSCVQLSWKSKDFHTIVIWFIQITRSLLYVVFEVFSWQDAS